MAPRLLVGVVTDWREFCAENAWHEAAQVLPILSEDLLDRLAADIERNGLRLPVVLHEGKVLDGRNRLLACGRVDVEPRFIEWEGDGSPLMWVLSMNLHRRQLTASQRAAVSLDVMPMLEAEARERMLSGKAPDPKALMPEGEARDLAAEVFTTSPRYVSDAKMIREESPEIFEEVRAGELTIPQAKVEISKRKRDDIQQHRAEYPTGRFQTIVIDPPWPMEKIDRDVRPNQAGFDYPAMTETELLGLPFDDLVESDCHLYLWTTHKYLPMALRLAAAWGFRYQCLLTWVKNVGFTPYSWMYSTEHVIFARKGQLEMRVLGLRLDFNAKVREHSRKPNEFYDLVRAVSPGPRLDMFARESHDGFESWGNQASHFDEAERVV